GFTEIGQATGVVVDEADREAASAGLVFGCAQRAGGKVDPRSVQAQRSGHQCVLAGTAAGVEHSAPDRARVGKGLERRLRMTDIPGRWSGIEVVGLYRLRRA